jgi:predicted DNA-binding protein with PD1-like motif
MIETAAERGRRRGGEGGGQVPSLKTLSAGESAARMWAFRLGPGADLKRALASFVGAEGLGAAFVAACVGSLSKARLRMPALAGEPDAVLTLEEPTEIVSLSGTLSPEGPHLHIALSRRDGQCLGGHLLDGCIVHTTAELVLGEMADLSFRRLQDPGTGHRELSVGRRDGETAG